MKCGAHNAYDLCSRNAFRRLSSSNVHRSPFVRICDQKISGKPTEGVINRNALIHGDYNSNTMDVSSRDAVKIMLMWVNLRLIADHFCNIEELYENRITMIPYFCTLPDDLAIDIMNRM